MTAVSFFSNSFLWRLSMEYERGESHAELSCPARPNTRSTYIQRRKKVYLTQHLLLEFLLQPLFALRMALIWEQALLPFISRLPLAH